MAPPSTSYEPRCPTASLLYRVVHEHFETFRAQAASLRDGEGLPRFVEAEFRNLVNGCLANGRGEAAEYLAGLGALLDLEGAAGVGRIDLVEGFFNADGSLKASASAAQMPDGFTWACEYGRFEAVEFLLRRGMDVNARLRPHQQTGLHFAAYGGNANIVKALLKRGARVDATDETLGTTPLFWAIYAWSEEPMAPPARCHEVVRALVAGGSVIKSEWLQEPKVLADSNMVAAPMST